MQGAEDKIVGHVGADLCRRLREITGPSTRQRTVQVTYDCRSPRAGQLTRQQLRRPATKEKRAAAESVRKTGKAARHVAAPGQAPNLVAQDARVGIGRRRPI